MPAEASTPASTTASAWLPAGSQVASGFQASIAGTPEDASSNSKVSISGGGRFQEREPVTGIVFAGSTGAPGNTGNIHR